MAGRPEVRADRIGVLGFSWGGVQTMRAARTPPQPGEPRFAAFRAMYPLCWAYNRVPGYELNQVYGPLQIGVGEKDDDEGSAACQALALRLDSSGQQVQAYANAFHGFEPLEPEVVVIDPYSHFGRGGMVSLKSNPGQGARAIGDALNFFERRLVR
ncbi:dienelactone hydrolase family protein [Inhella sp.]|uniref:dienelactone hydrolase family protein n=1 Tax=Inhella sp. TaxID=1921806 RepID=UPI0035AE0263